MIFRNSEYSDYSEYSEYSENSDKTTKTKMKFIDFLSSIFGNKAQRDMKAIQPLVDQIKAIYPEIQALSNDELRARSLEIKQQVQQAPADLRRQIDELKAKIEETEIQDRAPIFAQIDKLEKEVLEVFEKALEEVRPIAFAIVKSTAERFTNNEHIEVTATDFDRELAARHDFVDIEGDKAIYHNHWVAGGNETEWNMIHYDVQLFGGTSERRAITTTYDVVCLDRNVWYNGAPGRHYVMKLPGGTGYQVGQVNAETVVDIEGSDDVMPVINGTYKIMNAKSGYLMGFSSSPSTTNWESTKQYANSTALSLQWVVAPMTINSGEDFSCYSFTLNTGANLRLDLYNGSLSTGADVGSYPNDETPSKYQRWFLEYAGNGAFYIRSQQSALYLTVYKGSTAKGANIQLDAYTGGEEQQWRFVPANVAAKKTTINAPTDLTAVGQGSSVRLEWMPSTSSNIASYTLVRSHDGVHYVTIAKDLTETTFTDCEALDGINYSYQVYAIDQSLNYSPRSEVVTASVTGEPDQVLYLTFDKTLNDTTLNGNHCAVYGSALYQSNGKLTNALRLSGTNNFVQLPYTVASHDALTVACWVYWRGGDAWQRLWDFGNGTTQYMYFSPKSDSGMRFAIKNGGDEQEIRSTRNLPLNKWTHVALTIDSKGAKLYINGELEGENTEVDIRPSDFQPSLNYIGHSQFSADPDLKAYIDDFRIFNYALTQNQVNELVAYDDPVEHIYYTPWSTGDATYDLSGREVGKGQWQQTNRQIYVRGGKKFLR